MPNTTYRTLSILIDICVEWTGKASKQGKHAPKSISYEIQLLDSEATLYPPPANHIFLEKFPVSLHNTPDFELFYVRLHGIKRKNRRNKENMST